MDRFTLQSFLDCLLCNGQDSVNVQLERHAEGVKMFLAQDGERAGFVVIDDMALSENDVANYALKMAQNAMSRREAYRLIDGERAYQDERWKNSEDGPRKSVGEFLTLIRHYSHLADELYSKNDTNDAAREAVRKLAAIAVHCMEVNGAAERVIPKSSWEITPGYEPTVDDVRECLKSLHEQYGLDVCFTSDVIARWLKCPVTSLFNPKTETGPFYKMYEDAEVTYGFDNDAWGLRGGEIHWTS